jgi:hypothetical protein
MHTVEREELLTQAFADFNRFRENYRQLVERISMSHGNRVAPEDETIDLYRRYAGWANGQPGAQVPQNSFRLFFKEVISQVAAILTNLEQVLVVDAALSNTKTVIEAFRELPFFRNWKQCIESSPFETMDALNAIYVLMANRTHAAHPSRKSNRRDQKSTRKRASNRKQTVLPRVGTNQEEHPSAVNATCSATDEAQHIAAVKSFLKKKRGTTPIKQFAPQHGMSDTDYYCLGRGEWRCCEKKLEKVAISLATTSEFLYDPKYDKKRKKIPTARPSSLEKSARRNGKTPSI